MRDFPAAEVLHQTAHRPWPMPTSPWIMTQTWHDLLFAHWPVDARGLRARVPAGLELDLFDGEAWVGVVPFHLTNVAPRGVPAVSLVSAFAELNVRTYVTVQARPGVYFFSLDADSQVAVMAARTLFGLPYFRAAMEVVLQGDEIRYRSRRMSWDGIPAEFSARYRPTGDAVEAAKGTLDRFLTERYCLYTVDDESRVRRLDIHHPPWALQAAEATIDVNTMVQAAGIHLPSMPPRLHFARRQDVVAWAMTTVV